MVVDICIILAWINDVLHYIYKYMFKHECFLLAEESDARKELRDMVKSCLTEEIRRIKSTVDDQIKTTEDLLNKKIDVAEGGGSKSGKGGRGSAKGKKKWDSYNILWIILW